MIISQERNGLDIAVQPLVDLLEEDREAEEALSYSTSYGSLEECDRKKVERLIWKKIRQNRENMK